MTASLSVPDRIVKEVTIDAPPARVWKALTDHREFNKWFRVNLEGPFVMDQRTKGHINYPGYEHLVMDVLVVAMDPPKRFAYRWHPYGVHPPAGEFEKHSTLVEFRLEPKGAGTHLTVTESGFDKVPAALRVEAFRMNDGGWAEQMQNIRAHVAKNP